MVHQTLFTGYLAVCQGVNYKETEPVPYFNICLCTVVFNWA